MKCTDSRRPCSNICSRGVIQKAATCSSLRSSQPEVLVPTVLSAREKAVMRFFAGKMWIKRSIVRKMDTTAYCHRGKDVDRDVIQALERRLEQHVDDKLTPCRAQEIQVLESWSVQGS